MKLASMGDDLYMAIRPMPAMRATMGDRRFRQEYLCEFVRTESQPFDRDLPEGAMSYEFEPTRIQ